MTKPSEELKTRVFRWARKNVRWNPELERDEWPEIFETANYWYLKGRDDRPVVVPKKDLESSRWRYCPNCDNFFGELKLKYCHDCGTPLDWS